MCECCRYPLVFTGVREGLMDLLEIKERTNSVLNTATLSVLTVVTLLALKLRDLGLVLALSGASFGNALIYVFPALMFRATVKKMDSPSRTLQREVNVALGTGVLGPVLGILGISSAIQNAM